MCQLLQRPERAVQLVRLLGQLLEKGSSKAAVHGAAVLLGAICYGETAALIQPATSRWGARPGQARPCSDMLLWLAVPSARSVYLPAACVSAQGDQPLCVSAVCLLCVCCVSAVCLPHAAPSHLLTAPPLGPPPSQDHAARQLHRQRQLTLPSPST
jgi:hypothetical protein